MWDKFVQTISAAVINSDCQSSSIKSYHNKNKTKQKIFETDYLNNLMNDFFPQKFTVITSLYIASSPTQSLSCLLLQ